MTPQANLFALLRAGFPPELDEVAIEIADTSTSTGTDTDTSATAPCYSWRDLDRGTAMLANLLDSLGLPVGSRVAVQTDKSVEALMLYLAVLRAGLVYLPLNPAYQRDEMAYFIRDAEPAVVVCAPKHFGWVSRLAFAPGAGPHTTPHTAHVFTLGADREGSLLQRAAVHSDLHTPALRRADDVAAIVYTSGTTGRSKGAMLSHGNLASNAQVLQRHWRWKRGDVLIHALPIFHVHGLFVASHGALLNGSKTIWLTRFDAKTVVSNLARATVFMGVPTLYLRLLAEASFSRAACASMRLFVSGSAPLLRETFDRFRERSGFTILERYGMSETLMLTSNPCDVADGERRGGTVGLPLPGVRLRVTDTADTGTACRAEAIGAIEVIGPNVFEGYWRMPKETAQAFSADGWFKTGDLGRIDPLGYVTIVGRSKDLIVSGGLNVYPAEIEAALNEIEGVADSAVIGVPHPDFGEAVVAVVVAVVVEVGVADPSAGLEVIAQLKSKIANFKVPKRLVFVGELPRNAMGKVQKNLLRDTHKDLFA